MTIESSCPKCGFHEPSNRSQFPNSKDFLALLFSSEFPNDVQADQIRAERACFRSRMAELDNDIQALKKQLNALETEKKHIQHTVEDYNAVLLPLRKLPTETMREIFRLATECSLGNSHEMDTSWKIAQVSRRWRSIALNFPQMWSTIMLGCTDLDDLDCEDEECTNFVYFLAHHLQRAGSYPLSVYIHAHDEIAQDNPLIRTLIPTSQRWKKLVLSIRPDCFDAFTAIAYHLPELEVLSFMGPPPDDDEEDNLDMFTHAPRLHTIEATVEFFNRPELPLHQLINLDIKLISDSGPLSFLSTTKSLRFLDLNYDCSATDWDPTTMMPKQIELPLLEILRFEGPHTKASIERARTLLGRLCLPKLTHLAVVEYTVAYNTTLANFSTIQHLRISPMRRMLTSKQDALLFLPLIKALPSLLTIFFDNSAQMTLPFLDAFLPKTVAPSLQTIHGFLGKNDDAIVIARRERVLEERGLSLKFGTRAQDYYDQYGFGPR